MKRPGLALRTERFVCSTDTWVVFQTRVPFGVLCIRVLYYVGNPKRDPNLENYPHTPFMFSLNPQPLNSKPRDQIFYLEHT